MTNKKIALGQNLGQVVSKFSSAYETITDSNFIALAQNVAGTKSRSTNNIFSMVRQIYYMAKMLTLKLKLYVLVN